MIKTPIFYPIAFLVMTVITSCDRDHFISDSAYRKKVDSRFRIQEELARNRSKQLFKVFDRKLSLKEKEALKFLYAFMPLSDLADYDGEFYLRNVRASFAARDTFSWGKTIPEDVFRHFVLPVRVNNENLDSSRWVFFTELKERIKNLSMKQAALEVNHWCHEKVTYRGTDIRTSSPLATVRTAYGRCGEESTFTVAALRSVGIPARQCYTPRWAHGDDNHAWVEVWIDGKWHYIGASEPEPDLDMAWFTGPAKRAMLVNTNVFGDYTGSEDILLKDPRFTRINVLPNYTLTKRVYVQVLDTLRQAVDSAAVEFQLYNYAEFYPLSRSFTDEQGFCSFLTGMGDLLVWAAKKNSFAYQKVTVKDVDTVVLTLSSHPVNEYDINFDFIPPPEVKVVVTVSDSLRKINADRLIFEDKMRADYEMTFIDSVKTYRLARKLKADPDTLWDILERSRGNWRGIIDCISSVQEDQRKWIFPLLYNISEKDLRDVEPEVLTDNLPVSRTEYEKFDDPDVYKQYILTPRIDNEFLRPFKGYFRNKFNFNFIEDCRKDPGLLVNWIRTNIRIDNDANYGRAPITPAGVYDLKVSDSHSRDIFFVAVCRSFGIPARLEPATKIPQFLSGKEWTDVWFDKKPGTNSGKGTLILVNDPKNDRRPEYYIHFTVGHFKDGFYRSLDYEYDPALRSFPCTLLVNAGPYLLVTGNRISGGTVLSRLSFFNIEPGRTKEMTISLRREMVPAEILGKLDVASLLEEIKGQKTINLKPGKGAIIAWVDPLTEPSRHFVADLISKKEDLDRWEGSIFLLFKSEKEKSDFTSKNMGALPRSVSCLASTPQALAMFGNSIRKPVSGQFPVVAYISKRSDITYLSEGYRIGTGDDLLRSIISDEDQ